MVESGKAPAPGKPSPEPDALAVSRDPMEAADPMEALGGGERIDAAEEGRRARLRQGRCPSHSIAWILFSVSR